MGNSLASDYHNKKASSKPAGRRVLDEDPLFLLAVWWLVVSRWPPLPLVVILIPNSLLLEQEEASRNKAGWLVVVSRTKNKKGEEKISTV